MTFPFLRPFLFILTLAGWLCAEAARGEIIIAEGESFTPGDDKGWKVTHQNDSYGSHTYGGMWMTHGACLGAPAGSVGSVASKIVAVQEPGRFRVWSKYQAPPYYNYLHRIEIVQQRKTVFAHVYGKKGTERLWSFSGSSDELWWPWGVDHDAAEAPREMVELKAGPAEVRLITVPNVAPAGDRFVDVVVLTTNPADDYKGYKPYAVGNPFANEALAATRLWMRFKHDGPKAEQLSVSRGGHFQPQYGGATAKFPDTAVAAGPWSAWFNVGPFCRLVHDEGLTLKLPGAVELAVQFARDEAGKDLVGDLKMRNGQTVVVPLEITWKKGAVVKTSEAHAREILALSKSWRKANGGQRPKELLFYGAFSGSEDWVAELKAALGYNTLLPDKYKPVHRDGLHAHAHNPAEITKFAQGLKDKDRFRVLSFGDEIGLGQINFADPKQQVRFRDWLMAKGVTKADLGVEPAEAQLMAKGNPRLVWYSNQFNEEERFAVYRGMTRLAKQLIGEHVLTGANFSPHHLALYYGPIYQWVDLFRHNGMSMFWAEDYIFSVPEAPQILSWMFAQMRCGVKTHRQPIQFYVMPHAPGQEPGFLRRNMLFSVGCGASHIDNFWVAPAERFTENYIGWNYRATFRTLHDAIYESAEAESLQTGGKVRPARVALVTGRATDFHESRLLIDKSQDPFARHCRNAPAQVNQILCRKDQQMLYLALRHAQHAVDLITEDDIVAGALKDFDVVYFAGEWIDHRAVPRLDEWVKAGGILYASAGLGHLNQFGEPEPAMRRLLGLKDSKLSKNLVVVRTLLELPLSPEIDTITMGGDSISAIGMRQELVPGSARVLGTWKDGSAAVTVNEHGKGKVFAVGTAAGIAYMKTAVKAIPWARGGRHTLYNPVNFASAATKLVRLGVDVGKPEQAAVCSTPGVEAVVLDSKSGTLLTLVNWTNGPVKDLQVRVRLAAAPREVRLVSGQRALRSAFADGVLTFSLDLEEADYILLPR